jgi:hypothetical protein
MRIYCHGMQIILLDLAEKPKCGMWREGDATVKDYRRDAEDAEKDQGKPAARLTSWQVGAQPFEPTQSVLRMNRAVARFTSSAPTDSKTNERDSSCGVICAEKFFQRGTLGALLGVTAVSLPSRR